MILKFAFSPPMNEQPGDTFRIVGNKLQQWRGGVKIDERLLQNSTELEGFELIGGNQINGLYLEVTMPGQNVSCTKVIENQNTGAVTFSFSSGNNSEFGSWEEVGVLADSVDTTPDLPEKILINKAYRASPDGSNKTTQVGASVSINGQADVPVVYTEPE